MLRLGNLFGAALLRDMFLTPSPLHGGYERVLRRRHKVFRPTPTNSAIWFRHKSGAGPQETARRRRQLEKRHGMIHGKQLISGDTALLRFVDSSMYVQFDHPGHDYAYGWHEYPRCEFEVLLS